MFKWSLKYYLNQKKEMKMQAYKDALAAETGLYFSDIITTQEQGFPWSKYIVNALALFGSTYGTLGCLVSAFHLKIADLILLLVCGGLALMFSFMYIEKKFRVLAYLAIWVGSVLLVGNFYWIINSGMSAIHNICLNTIDDIFELPQLREYTEYYTDRYVSMTMALCVMALLITMLLNIFISEYMNPMAVMLITLPAAVFGMYFTFDADAFPMFALIGSWMLVFSVKSTNSYNGLTRKLKSASSVKKHKHSYGFITDSKNVSRIALQLLVFILLLTGSLFLVIPQKNFTLDLPTNSIKEKTNQGVKNYLSYGISTFFSRNSVKNNPGEIDNSGRLMFDGQKEFDVTLVDYGKGRMYLRQFVASSYRPGSFRWDYDVRMPKEEALKQEMEVQENEPIKTENTETTNTETETIDNKELEDKIRYLSDWKALYNTTGAVLQYDYHNQQAIAQTEHKIRIEIADQKAVGNRMLVPYYAVVDHGNVTFVSDGEIRLADDQMDYELTFYTQDRVAKDSQISDIYAGDVVSEELLTIEKNNVAYDEQYACDKAYLNVPTPNQEAVDAFIEKYHLADCIDDAVPKVVQALTENFDYTLNPGKVPFGEDFVNYFLTSAHKGYCVHFASAATLIFRRLGIPARYVEGYVVDAENFDEATELENEDAEDWIHGVDATNATVDKVPISDTNGHAWVEIYERGLGWVPVEVTLAQSIDDESGLGFLGDFFGGNGRVTSATEDIMNQVREIDVESTKANVARFGIFLLVVFIMWYGVYIARIVHRRHKGFSTENHAMHVSNRYRQLCAMLDLLEGDKYEQSVYCLSYQKISAILGDVMQYSEDDVNAFCESLETVIFAGNSVEEAAVKVLLEKMQFMRKQIKKEFTIIQKLQYYFIKVLW